MATNFRLNSWTGEDDRQQFLEKIKETDPEFFDRFDKSVKTQNDEKCINEFWVKNGYCNGDG